MICKNCGESLWVHRELDFSGESENECEEFEKDMSEEKIKLPVTYDSSTFVILDDSGEMLIDLEVTVPRTQDIVDGEYTEKAVQKMDAIGNQIADALNTAADLREKLRVAEEALRSALEASSPEYCDKPSMKQSMEFIWNTAAKALAAIA